MKAKEVHELKTEELEQKLKDLKRDLFNYRFNHTTGQLSNPMLMVACKKDIAKVKTVLRQRELSAKAKESK